MGNLTDKRKRIFYLLAFVLIVFVIYLYLELNGLSFGKNSSDFLHQHSRFFDYFRKNFWKTGDFMPSMTMNYGGTQDFSNLYYHGYLNPYLVLSLFFPFITTFTWIKIIEVLTLIFTYICSSILYRKIIQNYSYDKKRINFLIFAFATMTAFSPQVIFQFSTHFMFYYYYPVIFLSFIGIINIIEKNSPILFIITITLIFFTNFFFALVIGFMQLAFAGFYYYLFNKSNPDLSISIKQLIARMFTSYILGSLIGCILFIPQVLDIFTGSRESNPINITNPLNFDATLRSLFINGYGAGIGIITSFAAVGAVINFKRKEILFIIVPVFLAVASTHMSYILNILQYSHVKVFFYIVPIFMIAVFVISCAGEFKHKKISLLIGILLAGLYLNSIHYFNNINLDFSLLVEKFDQNKNLIILFMLSQILFFISIVLVKKPNKVISGILLFLMTVSCIHANALLITDKEYKKEILPKSMKNYYDEKIGTDFYRTFNYVNLNQAINHYNPIIYSSTINKNYFEFFNNYLSLPKRWGDRLDDELIRNNKFIMQIFGVKQNLVNNRDNITSPFIYGVENNNLFNVKSLDKVNNVGKLVGLTNYDYIKDSSKNVSVNGEKYLVKQGALNYKSKNPAEFVIDKATKGSGVYYFESKLVGPNHGRQKVCIKGICTTLRDTNLYREKPTTKISIVVDSEKFQANSNITLKIKDSTHVHEYQDYKLYFVPDSAFINKKNYIETQNNKVNNNESYNFDLTMQNDGYLVTSIFYDDDFIIKVNGIEVKKETVNNYFLGAKLKAGKNTIQISYSKKVKYIGLFLTLLGIILTIGYHYFIRKKNIINDSKKIELEKITIE